MTQSATQGDEDPGASLLRMMRGYWVSEAIFVAAQLGIADALASGPLRVADLAAKTTMPERALYRLLRALVSVGLFSQEADGTFGLTPLSDRLRSDAPGSLRASGIIAGRLFLRSWAELLPSLQSGRPSFERVFGSEFFAYLGARPDLAGRFQETMVELNSAANAAVPAAYDFGETGRIVDLGGGSGSLLSSILQQKPGLSGVLFDLPHSLADARQRLAEAGVLERCELVGGDFFVAVPRDGDIYMLRWILHDFDDKRATRLLRVCRAAMGQTSRLLVVEQIVPDTIGPDAWVSAFQDLQMLLLLGGQERTDAEFRALFAAGGFELRRVIATESPFHILECVPV